MQNYHESVIVGQQAVAGQITDVFTRAVTERRYKASDDVGGIAKDIHARNALGRLQL
jgi:hypothetical protein